MYRIEFDYAAILILIVILAYIFLRKLYHTRSEKVFLSLVICSFVATITDMISVSPNLGANVEFVGSFIYFLSRNLTILLYILYVFSISDTWHIFIKKKLVLFLSIIPYLVIVVLSILNIFNHCLFYYDANNEYVRGPLINILYVVAVIYLIYALTYVIIFRKLLRVDKIISVYMVFPLTVTALALQFFFPQMLLEMLFTAISILILFISVQRPDESIDSETKILNHKAYLEDSRKASLTKKKSTLIIFSILSYSKYSAVYDHEYSVLLKKNLGKEVKNSLAKHKLKGTFYSLNDGKYVLTVDEKKKEDCIELAKDIKEVLENKIAREHILIHFRSVCVIVECPLEIASHEEMSEFIDNLGKDESYSNEILLLSDLKNNNEYNIKINIDKITREAIDNKSFEVYYQPIYTIKDKVFRHAEALIRLNDPKYGFIAPDILIPSAERSGYIHEIGDIVLEKVCGFIASDEYEQLGLDYIEVNLSVAQCMDAYLPERIMSILHKYNVSPSKINLEITETVDMFDPIFEKNINRLAELGFEFSLDDYGTGYSNLSRLSTLPLSLIKFDKIFVDRMSDKKIAAVFRYSVRMIKSMHLRAVIEGVENKDMVDLFERYHVDYIQGYYFSKPIPKDDFIEFIKNNKK